MHDKMGKSEQAGKFYRSAMDVCKSDPEGILVKSATFKKASTNYAVTQEKIGERQAAIDVLNSVRGEFLNEVRVFNNLGIIQRRRGDLEEAK